MKKGLEGRENNFAQFKKKCIFALVNINPKPTSDETYSIDLLFVGRHPGDSRAGAGIPNRRPKQLYDAVWYPNLTDYYDFWNSAYVPNTARWHLEKSDAPTAWIQGSSISRPVDVFNVRVDRVCQ